MSNIGQLRERVGAAETRIGRIDEHARKLVDQLKGELRDLRDGFARERAEIERRQGEVEVIRAENQRQRAEIQRHHGEIEGVRAENQQLKGMLEGFLESLEQGHEAQLKDILKNLESLTGTLAVLAAPEPPAPARPTDAADPGTAPGSPENLELPGAEAGEIETSRVETEDAKATDEESNDADPNVLNATSLTDIKYPRKAVAAGPRFAEKRGDGPAAKAVRTTATPPPDAGAGDDGPGMQPLKESAIGEMSVRTIGELWSKESGQAASVIQTELLSLFPEITGETSHAVTQHSTISRDHFLRYCDEQRIPVPRFWADTA